ncbi:MAG: TatD family hydrolase [Serratia liquefaciens]|nr:TatD family hydrolase [Serratia liquefaciens]
MLLVDSHCHLDGLDYQALHQNVDDALAKAKARDVGYVLAVATTLPGYQAMTQLIGQRDDVAFSCGVHPLNLEGGYDYAELRRLAAAEQVVALGLREENAQDCGGVLHCFTEDCATAEALLALGLYISFSGILTFRNAEQLRDVARYVPLDRILVETDSPYLAPVPHRGKENQPAYVRDVAEYMAVLKGVSLETLAEATTANFSRLFHIEL